MTREEHIAWLKAIRDSVSGGDEEFDNKRRESLDAGISALLQEPCERFEWGIDGNVYKITKAKDGKEICQQVCDDAISREAVIELIERGVGNKSVTIDGFTFGKSLMLYHVKQLPSVTQKSGKWINDKNDIPICSRCGYIPQYDRALDDYEYSNYCPSCGARMVEPQESEDKE